MIPRTADSRTSESPSVGDLGNTGEAADSWETGGWGDLDNFEDKPETTVSKADVAKKKREERRRQREQALEEKRAGKGRMKLGAVKKAG